ncbi:MAG: DUF4190 domain-containing protein [Burkholderiales bacterium]|nr:DUF4190 domain-containing protein [Phycisphaerae bacterium]
MSLICGIVGCLVITPIVGLICGFIGIAKAKPPVGGKGMAIAGIILSLLWIGGGLVGAVAMYKGYEYAQAKMIEPAKSVTIGFANALVNDDRWTAQKLAPTLSDAEMDTMTAKFKSLGKMQSFSLRGLQTKQSVGDTLKFNVQGTGTFEKGSADLDVTLSGSLDHGFLIDGISAE